MAGGAQAGLAARSTKNMLRLLVVLSAALFGSAGTFAYWQAWLHLALQVASMAATNLYLLRHDRELLQRRLALDERGETEPVHKLFIAALRLCAIALPVVAGLDHRFGWSEVPSAVVIAACALFALGSLAVLWVFRENSYCSSVVEVSAEQTVAGSGPYRFVRHPMYTALLAMMVATPLTLGSYVAELFVPLLFALFVMRIQAEERLLAAELAGYVAYMRATPKRLIPGVW